MTPEEIQAHAAAIQSNGYAPPASFAAPQDVPMAPIPSPEAQSNVPPVQDGSQEPVQVMPAAPGERVQTASAFNVGPPSITPQQVAQHGEAAGEVNAQELQTAHDNRVGAVNEDAKVQKDIADAQAPIEEDRRDVLGAQALDEQAQMQEDAANAKKHFDTLMTYNKEIQDHVANQPTDLWGRAGVNKVAGIIGLVLGGLGGGATGGKNMVVDTLNTLVDQNLRQNEYKYEMLKGKVSTENQAYAQVRATSHDKQEAADRFKLLSLEQYKQQMQQAAAKFAGPQAKARADAAIAQIDNETAVLHEKMLAQSNANFAAAGQMALAERAQNLQSIQLQLADKDANRKEKDEQSVAYWEPTDKSHMGAGDASKLREQQGGAAQVQDILGAMIESARAGGVKGIIDNQQGIANLQIALIQQKALSKRVTEAEAKAMAAMTGFLATGDAAKLLTLMGASTVPEALFKAKQQFAQQHVTNIAIGYGLRPTEDNPFVRAATEKYQSNPTADVGGPQGANDPLAAIDGPKEIAQKAALQAQQQRNQMNPAGYGAM